MTLELNESIEKMSDRQLLELLVSNQMFIHFRLAEIEHALKLSEYKASEAVIHRAIDMSKSFYKQIDTELKNLITEQEC